MGKAPTPDTYAVKVRLTGQKLDVPMYIADGNFLYEAEGAEGVWQKIADPVLPTS